VLVTGRWLFSTNLTYNSTQGIGLATADVFAKFGASVAYHGRRLEEARRVAKEAHDNYGVKTIGIAADGTKKGAMEKVAVDVRSLHKVD